MTVSEFYQSVKSGQDVAIAQAQQSAAIAHTPQRVAETILTVIQSGEAQVDLVPRAYGGSYEG
jgi:alkanesulfonate monooxygenase SsuD/methylene tetrahydromethanopterin reductase-like flavin-dependent oxidoreductase (luciferase family)